MKKMLFFTILPLVLTGCMGKTLITEEPKVNPAVSGEVIKPIPITTPEKPSTKPTPKPNTPKTETKPDPKTDEMTEELDSIIDDMISGL